MKPIEYQGQGRRSFFL